MAEKDVTFRFKEFSVRQDRCAMKVGTDGVLLGALARVESQESRVESQESRVESQESMFNVLDIGTGTGVVALMLAQRYPEARIVGVEIDPEAAAQAAENFAASPWGDRLIARCGDVNVNVNENENENETDNKFQLIVCNPPYYAHSPAASSRARDTARRADSLTHEQLVECAARLMADGGRLEVIIPYTTADEFIHTAWLHGLHLMRRIDIRTKPGKAFKRSVVAVANENENGHTPPSQATPPLTEGEELGNLLLFNADGSATEEYRALTGEFYLD